MAISPSTDLYLIKLPIELNDENQLTFSDATAQANYFLGLQKIGETDFTYQRRENAIRYPAHVDSIIQYNYVMYKNANYSNKWFYARILNMEYVNDNLTLISIEEDAFQTWQFDLGYSQCFVEREHVMDDTIGAHTVPENLEVGEYAIQGMFNIPMYEKAASNTWPAFFVAFSVTEYPDSTVTIAGESRTIGGVWNAMHFFAVPPSRGQTILDIYALAGKADAIKNVFMVPQCVVNFDPATEKLADGTTNPTSITGDNGTTAKSTAVWPLHDSYATSALHLPQPADLAGQYQPRNNKLKTYPFCYFYLANNTGEQAIYHWEDFPFETYGESPNTYEARSFAFKKCFVPSASLSVKLYPINYKGHAEGDGYGSKPYAYGLNFSKVPVCAWTTDYYTNWLTQNGVNINTQIGLAAGGALLGLATGGVGLVAGAAGVASTIANTVASMHQAQITPDQAQGDINSGDFVFGYIKCSISMYYMSVRPEFAAIIDKYFDAYGYKVNTIKLPNITGRTNWNFVKTVGSAIHADIPQDSCDRINHMFDNGLTLWHNPSTFRDYTQSNTIVTP